MLKLVRPVNCLVAAAVVWLGAYLAGNPLDLHVLTAALVVLLFTAAGNVDNDLQDQEMDRVNRPERPLPSGRVSPARARRFRNLLYAAGFFAALWQHLLVLAFIAWGLLYFYNRRWKRVPLVGNLVVALLTVFPLWYGVPMAKIPHLWWPSLLIFLVQLARELLKDAEDLEGDSRAGVRTLAAYLGVAGTVKTAAFLNLLLWSASLVVWSRGVSGDGFMLVVSLGIVPVTAWYFVRFWRHPRGETLHDLQRAHKLVMFMGILALLWGV